MQPKSSCDHDGLAEKAHNIIMLSVIHYLPYDIGPQFCLTKECRFIRAVLKVQTPTLKTEVLVLQGKLFTQPFTAVIVEVFVDRGDGTS